MSVIANNLANMNTTAYKSERMMFVDQIERARADTPSGVQSLSFVRDLASYRRTQDGPLEQTGNPLDVAIHGKGYFVVQTKDGEQYTRNGNFRLDNNRQLVTQTGLPVLSTAGAPIFFAPEDTTITISGDGSISTENGTLGKIRVVTFKNEQDMQRHAEGLYTTQQTPQEKQDAQLAQGTLEGSNVQAITEMTRMIEVSRQYKSVQNLIDREDQRIRQMVRELPTLGQG